MTGKPRPKGTALNKLVNRSRSGVVRVDQRTRIVAAVMKGMKLPPRFRLRLVKEDPVRLELSVTPAYGKDPIIVGIVESLDLVARRDREGRIPRDLQGTWDWTVRHGQVSTGGWNPYLKEALQTMFETCLLYTSPSPRD